MRRGGGDSGDACEPLIYKERLLLIEDHELSLRAMTRVLERIGFVVHPARSFVEAKAALDREFFAYAIVDDQLPDGSGLALMPYIERCRPRPSAVLVSAYIGTCRTLQALNLGYELVPKPKTPDDFTTLTDHLCRNRRARRSYPPLNSIPQKIGTLVLDDDGLTTPSGRISLTPTAILVLSTLANSNEEPVSIERLARAVLGRRDTRAFALVRRHIANLRQALGSYRTLIRTASTGGYQLTPDALPTAANQSKSFRARSVLALPLK